MVWEKSGVKGPMMEEEAVSHPKTMPLRGVKTLAKHLSGYFKGHENALVSK